MGRSNGSPPRLETGQKGAWYRLQVTGIGYTWAGKQKAQRSGWANRLNFGGL
jgi:hypothetical protein